MSCDIVLLVYNNLEITRNCVDSLLRHWRSQDRLLIVDNGSDEETRHYLESLAKQPGPAAIEVMRLVPNQGFIKAANAGMAAGKASLVCLLSNDTVVTRGWLDAMEAHLAADPRIGLVNPQSTTFGRYPHAGQSIDAFAAELSAGGAQRTETACCVGFCLLVRRCVLEKIGLLDEVFGAGYFEDSDFSRRAIEAGFLCVIAHNAYVWHREHSTFKSGEREAQFRRNRGVFEKRWGRPRRLLCCCDRGLGDTGRRKHVLDFCLAQARAGNWVRLLVDRKDLALVEPVRVHGNISVVPLSRRRLSIQPLLMVLLKRKKPFDEVYLDKNLQAGWNRILKLLLQDRVKEIPYGTI